jgi:type IV secretion system protein VirB1
MFRNAFEDTTRHSKVKGNAVRFGSLGCLCVLLGSLTSAHPQPPHARLSQAEFLSLAGRCAQGAPADTLLAIASTESALYSNAISINRPAAAALRAGYSDGQLVLAKQPKDRNEAVYWLHWFESHRYTVSVGLMQVNSEMAPRFHLKPEQLLEPCTNLHVGAAILISAYTDMAHLVGEGFSALDAALSLYNTGNATAGFHNGYVATVYAHAPRRSSLFLGGDAVNGHTRVR